MIKYAEHFLSAGTLGCDRQFFLTNFIEAGINQKAVDVLNNAELKARINEVGHIAVEP